MSTSRGSHLNWFCCIAQTRSIVLTVTSNLNWDRKQNESRTGYSTLSPFTPFCLGAVGFVTVMRRHFRRCGRGPLLSFWQLITPVGFIIYKAAHATAFYSVAAVWESATKSGRDSVLHSTGSCATDDVAYLTFENKIVRKASISNITSYGRCLVPKHQIGFLLLFYLDPFWSGIGDTSRRPNSAHLCSEPTQVEIRGRWPTYVAIKRSIKFRLGRFGLKVVETSVNFWFFSSTTESVAFPLLRSSRLTDAWQRS